MFIKARVPFEAAQSPMIPEIDSRVSLLLITVSLTRSRISFCKLKGKITIKGFTMLSFKYGVKLKILSKNIVKGKIDKTKKYASWAPVAVTLSSFRRKINSINKIK